MEAGRRAVAGVAGRGVEDGEVGDAVKEEVKGKEICENRD